jgi:hypothetical protein
MLQFVHLGSHPSCPITILSSRCRSQKWICSLPGLLHLPKQSRTGHSILAAPARILMQHSCGRAGSSDINTSFTWCRWLMVFSGFFVHSSLPLEHASRNWCFGGPCFWDTAPHNWHCTFESALSRWVLPSPTPLCHSNACFDIMVGAFTPSTATALVFLSFVFSPLSKIFPCSCRSISVPFLDHCQ